MSKQRFEVSIYSGTRQERIEDARAALAANPEDDLASNALATFLYNDGQYEEAIRIANGVAPNGESVEPVPGESLQKFALRTLIAANVRLRPVVESEFLKVRSREVTEVALSQHDWVLCTLREQADDLQ